MKSVDTGMEAEAFQFGMDVNKSWTKALEFSGVQQVKWDNSLHSLVTPSVLLKLRVHMHVAGPAGRPRIGHHPLALMKLSYMYEHGHPGLGPGDWQAGGSGQGPASWNHCLPLTLHWKSPQGE